jgi:hypothetical protein
VERSEKLWGTFGEDLGETEKRLRSGARTSFSSSSSLFFFFCASIFSVICQHSKEALSLVGLLNDGMVD